MNMILRMEGSLNTCLNSFCNKNFSVLINVNNE
jgi:hypothetical protein